MRARACIRCKEYIVIHPNNPLNQAEINTFEQIHHQHTLITVNLSEIKNEYQNSKTNGKSDDNSNQEEINSHA